MRKFKLVFLIFFTLLFISACNSDSQDKTNSIHICPECSMELPLSNIHTAKIQIDEEIHYFDDPGCMILWSKKKEIDLKTITVKIFSNDTNKYINANNAFYTINETTPMHYGFSAYENKRENTIDFEEVKIRILRGEHMANPKIRKHILGY